MALDDPTTDIVRGAAALYGLALGKADLQRVLFEARLLPGGVDELADRLLLGDTLALPDAALAALVVRNLHLTPRAALAAGPVLLDAFQAAGFEHRGKAVLDALRLLGQLQSEPLSPFLADAREVQARVDEALARAIVSGSATVPWLSIGPRDLSTGADEVRLMVDAATSPLTLPRRDGVTLVSIESRTGPAGEQGAVQVSGVADAQRVDLSRSQVDVDLTLALPEYTLLQDLIVGLVDTASGVQHRVAFSGLSAPPVDAQSLHLQLMDTRAATSPDPALATRPLKDLPYNGFSFVLGSQRVVLKDELPNSEALGSFNGAQTYDQLLLAVRALLTRPDHLERWPALALLQADLGPAFEAIDTRSGVQASGRSIVLHLQPGSGLGLQHGNFVADDGVPASADYHIVMDERDHARVLDPVATVVLDGAGTGGAGAALAIGAADADALPGGVAQLRLVVERDSNITHLAGLHGHLEQLRADSGLAGGRLSLCGDDAQVTTSASDVAAFGLVDLRVVDLSGLQAAADVDLAVTTEAAARYTSAAEVDEGVVMRGGAGSDRLAVQVDGELAAHARFRLQLGGGDGDDLLHLIVPVRADGGVPHGRLSVDGGPGDDTLVLTAAHQPVQVRVGLAAGHDRIVGLAAGDRIDLSALGGLRLGASLATEPAPASLAASADAITLTPAGPATRDAAGVASRFVADAANASPVTQLLLSWDPSQLARIWRVTDGAGPAGVTVDLVGQLGLEEGLAWSQLTAASFGT